MRATAMSEATDHEEFTRQFEAALKAPNDDAARAMLARGRTISYRERDTPPGHVVREHPDGTRETVRIDLAAAIRDA